MVTGDGAYIKKINRSVILKNIIEHGKISRADLSKITGLNKATISVQVASLLDDELIYETQLEHNTVGRRPIMLSINRKAGYVLGIDLDYNEIQYTVSDLQGLPVQSDTVRLETDDYDTIVKQLIEHINGYNTQYAIGRYGLIRVIFGIHGTVNQDESILFVPKFQWHHKDLKAALQKELTISISIENNANLAAYAESVYKHQKNSNLLNLNISSGIGAGIMIDGKLYKGYHGFAGEMGHMIIFPNGDRCKCGNHGCWELYASEPRFIKQLEKELGKSNITFDDVQQLIHADDPVTHHVLDQFIKHIAIGLNNIINLYNPETLVINSRILRMYPHVIDQIKTNLHSSVSEYREIVISDLGNKACVMGACALAIKRFLQVPELILTDPEAFEVETAPF
jgi:predicted NBD/HSP70 family sugar kinase